MTAEEKLPIDRSCLFPQLALGLFYYDSPCLPNNLSERTLFWRDRRHIYLSVSVRIPPVDMARNPWPSSLVGLETQLCFSSAPNDKKQFSATKAVPCNAGGQSDQSALVFVSATWQSKGTAPAEWLSISDRADT